MLDFLIGNDLLLSLIAFGIVLIPAVIIHELGHFLAAKAVGITVLEFGIGFPPRAAKLFMWGETEFTLNWIPLGGFVRPLGEDLIRPLGEDAVEQERQRLQVAVDQETSQIIGDPRFPPPQLIDKELADNQTPLERLHRLENTMTVNETKPLLRIIFMAAGAFANFLSAFLLFSLIALLGLPTPVGARMGVVEIAAGSTLEQAGILPNDLIERVDRKLFLGRSEFIKTISSHTDEPVTLSVFRSDTNERFDVDVVLGPTTIENFIRVLSVEQDSPAHRAGLLPDDLIASLDGQSITSENDPIAVIQDYTLLHAGEEIVIEVLRGGDSSSYMALNLMPRINPQEGQGRIGIGIRAEFRSNNGATFVDGPLQMELMPLSLGDALDYGFDRTISVLGLIVEFPLRIMRGTIPAEQARPMSIVGISQAGGQFLEQSIEDQSPGLILNFIAMISIALGVTNLLPFPAFDGGRIMFVLLEIVRGRPISPEREGLVHLIGFVFFLSVGLLIILNDLLHPLPSLLP